jgi:hypothetical protein
MRRSLIPALAIAALASCATLPPLRPVDNPQLGVRADAATGQAELDGVKLAARADDWHNWLSDVQSRATPVEVALHNGSESDLLIRPELFALVLPNGARLTALPPGEVHKALLGLAVADRASSPRIVGPRLDPFTGRYDPSRTVSLYTWPGLQGRGAVSPPVTSLGPDARPIPEGTVAPGRSASVLLFFDTPADKLKSFVLEADLQRPDGGRIGVERIAFAR